MTPTELIWLLRVAAPLVVGLGAGVMAARQQASRRRTLWYLSGITGAALAPIVADWAVSMVVGTSEERRMLIQWQALLFYVPLAIVVGLSNSLPLGVVGIGTGMALSRLSQRPVRGR